MKPLVPTTQACSLVCATNDSPSGEILQPLKALWLSFAFSANHVKVRINLLNKIEMEIKP